MSATRQGRFNRLEVGAGLHTAVGGRPRNEDYAAVFTGTPGQQAASGILAAIADGVGGSKGGRVASELAVRAFIDGYYGLGAMRGVRRNAAQSLDAVNRWIFTLGRTDSALENMACAFTALILRGRLAHFAHVGDTRLYRLRDDALARLTNDHTPGRPGTSSMLTRAIGIADTVLIDYGVEQARVHDRYLLCSDGVHGGLSDARIRDQLARRAGPEETARQLVETALAAGGASDNATAVVLDVLDLPIADQLDLEAVIAAQPIVEPPKTDAVVDGFRMDAMLSDGQYSRVFRSVDTIGARPVILKFPKSVTGADAVLRQAFLREAWIAARVKSPFVTEVIDVPPDRRTCLYTVMPFYDGETLEARLRRKPVVSLGGGLDIAIMLGKAVAALHRAGIIHRDIKPENVVLQRDGLKLIDLGVARLPHMEEFPAGDTPGTPSYKAPELFRGAPGDERSDLFALGVTVYRMFAGSYPYGEIEPFSRPRFGRPASLLARRPDLPAWLDQVLARAVAVAPEDRFEDVIEFIFAIEHGARGAVAAPPRRQPLHDRDPLRFWQAVAALLACLLLASLALR